MRIVRLSSWNDVPEVPWPEPDDGPSTHRPVVEPQLDVGRMCRTEAILRFACRLVTTHAVSADVVVSLVGRELIRFHAPRFPVVRFLSERGFVQSKPGGAEWRGRYYMRASPHGIRLGDGSEGFEGSQSLDGADLIAPLVGGRRLVAFGTRGPLEETRSPGEHKLLRATLGRLVTWEHYQPDDVAAAIVPRSQRFRQLAVAWRRSRFIAGAGDILIVSVDRAGGLEGFIKS